MRRLLPVFHVQTSRRYFYRVSEWLEEVSVCKRWLRYRQAYNIMNPTKSREALTRSQVSWAA